MQLISLWFQFCSRTNFADCVLSCQGQQSEYQHPAAGITREAFGIRYFIIAYLDRETTLDVFNLCQKFIHKSWGHWGVSGLSATERIRFDVVVLFCVSDSWFGTAKKSGNRTASTFFLFNYMEVSLRKPTGALTIGEQDDRGLWNTTRAGI